MKPSDTPLAAGFPVATRQAWRALVEETLKGAAIDSLASLSADGARVEPLYESAGGGEDRYLGRPTVTGGWDVRAAVSAPSLTSAKAQVGEDLAGGAHSLLIAVDPAAEHGVALASAEDFGGLLADVAIEATPLAIDGAFLGPFCAEWAAAAVKASPRARLAFHFDPLSALALAGASPGPIEGHIDRCAAAAASLVETFPACTIFLASGAAVHEAGGTEAEELAFALAAALTYAKALAGAGVALDLAWRRIVLGLAADQEAFATIIKLRAARRLWAALTGACGAAAPASIEARSSRRMLTRAEPWTNLVRLTSAGFAAAAGGADAVVLGAFTDAIGRPTPFARRLARNTQLILMEEAGVGRVGDPAAGSGYVEAATGDLAAAAWRRFQAIEAAGGAARALSGGLIDEWMTAAKAALARRLADGELRLVGVTDFAPTEASSVEVAEEAGSPTSAPDPGIDGPDSACPPLLAVRLEELAP